jgi:hypothetical protein
VGYTLGELEYTFVGYTLVGYTLVGYTLVGYTLTEYPVAEYAHGEDVLVWVVYTPEGPKLAPGPYSGPSISNVSVRP